MSAYLKYAYKSEPSANGSQRALRAKKNITSGVLCSAARVRVVVYVKQPTAASRGTLNRWLLSHIEMSRKSNLRTTQPTTRALQRAQRRLMLTSSAGPVGEVLGEVRPASHAEPPCRDLRHSRQQRVELRPVLRQHRFVRVQLRGRQAVTWRSDGVGSVVW